jgi:hypothetical protein
MLFERQSNGNRTALVSAFVVVCGKWLGIHDEWQVSTRKTEGTYELPIGNFSIVPFRAKGGGSASFNTPSSFVYIQTFKVGIRVAF